MSTKRPEKCKKKNEFELLMSALQIAADDIHNLQEIIPRLENVREEIGNELHRSADARFNNSIEASSDALLNWLLLKEEGEQYDEDYYEYILKIGTVLQEISVNLLDVTSKKTGISDEVLSSLKREISSLLREIYLRNC
ncbi:MAG: hypothetical protein KME16_15075 [Scytolyngbya sp. HA4215-MV1]|jgi:hypothetical protein|nr:hypothetical protein [Scytolyngbya sp. HA4215-MV1]